MKSVIAQGSTIAKAIEEALKKAGMPAEFFVKLLEDAQGGFLGFGAKKAKIALFFKQNHHSFKHEDLLSQETYQDLFDNRELDQQIEQQLKGVSTVKNQPQHQPQQPPRTMQQRHPQKPIQHRPQPPKPMAPQTSKPSTPKPQQPNQSNQNFEQRKGSAQSPQQQPQQKENKHPSKLMVRPLPNKNNDSSKS